MSTVARLRLFEAYGVELEYMIVDRRTLSVLPITDEVLRAVAGRYASDVEQGEITWSNELVLHVIELKTTGPAPSLDGLPEKFQENVRRINDLLEPLGARLMPTAMHPWMDPLEETRLWPHEYNAVYETFNRIFDCRGHGWSNLQSTHINFPFADSEEFGRLHAAIRLVLPVLPALAASSPIVEGRLTGLLDNRMEFYRNNSRKIPSVAGLVIPEPVFDPDEYDRTILQRIYRDLSPHDAEGVLQEEFANARGAIARFERGSIEIRVVDVQECPAADLALCHAVSAVLRALVEQRWTGLVEQQSLAAEPMADILAAVIRDGERAVIRDPAYLAQFGVAATRCTAGELWRRLVDATCLLSGASSGDWQDALNVMLDQGPLARRILRRLAPDPSCERASAVYRELCDCLALGRPFSIAD
ncbi:MAG: glutamate--cysteine ligase [Pirellulales bacterium]|nr:glutamate--cysteine ligase [Pirellulales bacterium]